MSSPRFRQSETDAQDAPRHTRGSPNVERAAISAVLAHRPATSARWQPQPPHVTKPEEVNEESLAARHIWCVPKKPRKDAKKNRVENHYYEAWGSGFGRWLSSIVVLGMTAFIISNGPDTPLLEATAANLACAALHVFTFGPYARSRSPTDARPPKWYLNLLTASSVLWAAAFASMVAVVSIQDPYNLSALRKRSKGGMIGSTFNTAGNLSEYITVTATAFSGMSFACCLLQWYFVVRLLKGKFSDEDIREVYMKASQESSSENSRESEGAVQDQRYA